METKTDKKRIACIAICILVASFLISNFRKEVWQFITCQFTVDTALAVMKDGQGRPLWGSSRLSLSAYNAKRCREAEERRLKEAEKALAAQQSRNAAYRQQSMVPASPRASAQRPIKGDYSNRPLIGSYSIDNITTEIVISPGGATGASIVRDGSGMLSVRLFFGSANDAKWWLYEGRYSSGLSFRTILSKAMSSGIGTILPISW